MNAFAQDLEALVIELLHLHSYVYTLVLPVSVARAVRFMLPKKLQFVLVVQVLFVEVEKSTDPILGISCVIVATPAVVNVAVSCGSGTRDDHVAVDHVAPDCQSVVTGVVNVMLLFPQQSPLFPVIADKFQLPAPAQFISCMSTFEAVTVQAVRVT